jgi:hypothetical protein
MAKRRNLLGAAEAGKPAETPPPAQRPAMITIDELHERIGRRVITRQALYLAAERGDFETVRLGRRILVPLAAAEAKFRLA